MIRRSLRLRMMALFCVVVGVLLAASDAGLYVVFNRAVRAQVDRRLLETANPIIADLIGDPTENDVDQLSIPGQYFEVLDESGRVLQRSRNLQEQSLAIDSRFLNSNASGFLDIPRSGETLRAGFVPFRIEGGVQFLVVAGSTRDADEALRAARRLMFALFLFSLVLTAAVSSWYANRSLRPVAELTRRASDMSENPSPSSGFHLPPLPVGGAGDELDVLAATFNRLFARLTSAMQQLRQFVSDAAHELRTPLAVLHGETELTLSRPRSAAEYESALRVIDGELKTLSRIVEGLFTLSMADAGQLQAQFEPLYVEEALEEACAVAAPIAQAKGIDIRRDLQRDVAFRGDPAFLRQLFLIFLDNAIKYSPPNSTLEVRLRSAKDRVEISFQDHGAGIEPQYLPRIFERFFRGPQPSSGSSQSGGLGLAIGQAIVQAHGGSIQCVSEPGVGSTFTVILPNPAAISG